MNEIGIEWLILGFFFMMRWIAIVKILIDEQSELKMMTKPPKK